MRLSEFEINALVEVIRGHLKQEPFKLYLFGSRTDDHKKGGDIDLLLRTTLNTRESLLAKKGLIKSDLSEALGDQRVDLTLAQLDERDDDPFLRAIASSQKLLIESP